MIKLLSVLRTTFYSLICLLSFFHYSNVVYAAGSSQTCASPSALEPTYDSATVNGLTNDWNLSLDYFTDLYIGGFSTKAIEGSLYLETACRLELILGQQILSMHGMTLLIRMIN